MAVDMDALKADAEHIRTVIKNIHEYLSGVNSSIMSMNGQVQDIMTKDNIDKYNKKLEEAASASISISKALTEDQDLVKKNLLDLGKVVRSLNTNKNTLSKLIAGGNELVDKVNALGAIQDKLMELESIASALGKVDDLQQVLNKIQTEIAQLSRSGLGLQSAIDDALGLPQAMGAIQQDLESINKSNADFLVSIKSNSDVLSGQITEFKNQFDDWSEKIAQADRELQEHIAERIESISNDGVDGEGRISEIEELLDNVSSQQMALAGFLMEVKLLASKLNEGFASSNADNKTCTEELSRIFAETLDRLEDEQAFLAKELPAKVREALNDIPDKVDDRISYLPTRIEELLNDLRDKLNDELQEPIQTMTSLSSQLEDFSVRQQEVYNDMEDRFNSIINQQTEVANSQQDIADKQSASISKQESFFADLDSVKQQLQELMSKQEATGRSYDNIAAHQQEAMEMQQRILDAQQEVLGRLDSTSKGYEELNSSLRSTELDIVEQVNMVITAQRELKAQQRTLLEAQQHQINILEDPKKKGGGIQGKKVLLMSAGIGAAVGTIIMAITVGVLFFSGVNFNYGGSEQSAVTIGSHASDGVEGEEMTAADDIVDNDGRHSDMTIDEAIDRKEQYRSDVYILSEDAQKYLQKNKDFTDGQKYIERAYRIMMDLNQFRLEAAHAGKIPEDIRNQLLKVIDLEHDSVEGLYRGMTESREGKGYQQGFRYSKASINALEDEDSVLMDMYEK